MSGGIAYFGTMETVGKEERLWRICFQEEVCFRLRLKDESEVAAQTSSGIFLGASKLKLLPNCFGDF